jgi:hypothetical protein
MGQSESRRWMMRGRPYGGEGQVGEAFLLRV